MKRSSTNAAMPETTARKAFTFGGCRRTHELITYRTRSKNNVQSSKQYLRTIAYKILTLVCFWLFVCFVVTSLCYGVEVVGVGECADCKDNNIKTSQAFSGLRVTVECKSGNGELKRRGVGELDGNGNFKVSLPHDFVIKEECYAELHNAISAAPCPAHDGIFHHTKIVIKSKEGGDHEYTLGPTHKLKFSSLTCTSTFFWPFFNHHHFFPKLHHPHDFTFPPINKVFPPKHPLPPPVPVYEKPPPVTKPFPPLPSPISKPLPPPPPPPSPIPDYEPPFFKPHLPPFHKLHPFPPLPKIPGKYFHQPMFGKWPPLPTFSPHA